MPQTATTRTGKALALVAIAATLATTGAANAGVIIAPPDDDIATRVFNFASLGSAYSAAIFGNDEIVGKEVVRTRIYLDLDVTAGGDAATFSANLLLPIIPSDENVNVVLLNGGDLGWSGSGKFSHFAETTEFNGVFRAGGFGGESDGPFGFILEGSRVEVDYIVPSPGAAGLLAMGGLAATRRRR